MDPNAPPPPPPPPPPPAPNDPNAPPPPPAAPGNDLIQVASRESRLSTLVSAIKAAGLVESLSGKDTGPYTLFAPVNSAFARL
ncbi:MAG: fasciclin domain-containing protein, partial [Cytophagales bacterium]|nr:fasciclin domain-containing protein [Armatimonadota bacterium]